MRALSLAGLASLAPLLAAPAAASPIELFGASPRTGAMAGAGVALPADGVSDYAAAWHNPAMAAFSERVAASIGYRAGFTRLRYLGALEQGDDVRGTLIGASLAHDLGPLRGGLSALLYMPDQGIVRIRIVQPTRPHFPMYENRPHRVSADIGYGLRFEGLALGGGVTVLGHAIGDGAEIELAPDLARLDDATAHRVGVDLDLELPMSYAPNLGAQWRLPWLDERLTLGASWRGQLQFDIRIATRVNLDAFPLEGTAALLGKHTTYFTPARTQLGASFRLPGNLLVAAQLDWLRWSAWDDLVPDIAVELDLGVPYEPGVTGFDPATLALRDTFVPRLGVEWTALRGRVAALTVRGGWAWEPSPVPDQTGLSNLLDSDKQVFGLGVEALFDGGEILPRGFTLSGEAQLHELAERRARKSDRTNPYPDVALDGRLVHLGVQLGVRL